MIEQTGTTTIGRYELVRELGRGAMGQVYLAYDPHLNRQVAIKVIIESGSDDAYFWKAFQREAKLIGSLRHPNILTVYDFGSANGQAYLVMEYVDG
ncbi:MAG: protein kinase, partial [Chloroflexi bacterium]|nr:protein kinase [Chloroflexota bacterium]